MVIRSMARKTKEAVHWIAAIELENDPKASTGSQRDHCNEDVQELGKKVVAGHVVGLLAASGEAWDVASTCRATRTPERQQ